MIHLETGKYAAYIWPAYALTAVVWAVLIGSTLAHARRWRAKAEAGRKS